MTDAQMSSEIKWHNLDESIISSYPEHAGELYLIRICRYSTKTHYYSIARLWRCEEYKKHHPAYNGLKYKYVFVSDEDESPFGRKASHSDYVDGWADMQFAAAAHNPSGSGSPNSKTWLDLRRKHK